MDKIFFNGMYRPCMYNFNIKNALMAYYLKDKIFFHLLVLSSYYFGVGLGGSWYVSDFEWEFSMKTPSSATGAYHL